MYVYELYWSLIANGFLLLFPSRNQNQGERKRDVLHLTALLVYWTVSNNISVWHNCHLLKFIDAVAANFHT